MAISLNPNYSIAYNNRGAAYEKLGKYTEAITDYKKALTINPDNALAKSNLKNAEKAQSKHKLSLLSKRSNDSFAALNLNSKPPSAIPAALLSMMKQEDELLAALLEHTQKSDELHADTARNITAAINQWRHYPLIACPQPSEATPSLTPHISDFLRRKETIYRYIAEVRQALLQIKDAANTSSWKIKHWLTGKPTSGTPRHIKQIKDLLSPINEYSSTEAVMNAYEKIISLLPTTAKKSRLPETSSFYAAVKFNLNQIMFNPPAACLPAAVDELAVEGPSLEVPPSYDEHVLQEQEQCAVLKERFPHHTIDVTADAYFLREAGALYPVIINKLRFNEDVAEKSKPVEIHPAPLFSAAESAAIAQEPASAVATPVISSSSSSFFAVKPMQLSAADAAAVDIAESLERQLPPVPTHALPEVKSANDDAPAQRQMMLA